jgi:UTP:GlnB (protein PII) uridylyltransferase
MANPMRKKLKFTKPLAAINQGKHLLMSFRVALKLVAAFLKNVLDFDFRRSVSVQLKLSFHRTDCAFSYW